MCAAGWGSPGKIITRDAVRGSAAWWRPSLVVALVLEERRVCSRARSPGSCILCSKAYWTGEGVSLGRDRFVEVLRAKDLLLEPRPVEYPCTTNSHHCLPVCFTNRIKGLMVR